MPPAGLLFGLAAAAGWGLTDVTAAVAGRRISPLVLAVTAQSIGLGLFVLVLLVSGRSLTATAAGDAALFGMIASLGYVASFAALRIGPLAVVSPVIAAWGGLTVVLAVVFRGETLTVGDWIGVLLATIGVALVGLVLDGGSRPRLVSRGVGFALLANLGFAIPTVGLAAPIQEVGWLPVTVISRVANLSTVVMLIVIAMTIARVRGGAGGRPGGLRGQARGSLLAGIAAVGAFDAVATISFSVGLEVAETWLVGLASSFGPALAVVFAVGVLGERLRPMQWLGLAALVAAVVVLALPG